MTIKEKWLGHKVDQYQDEIRKRNHRDFGNFAMIGCVISAAVVVFGLTLADIVTFNVEFSLMLCYCAVLRLISRRLRRWRPACMTALCYLAISPLMVLGILMGTFLDPLQPSITIMIFLCVLPLFILDKPRRVTAYITLMAAAYCVCCYLAKDRQLFMEDMIDLVAFYFLGIGVNFVMLIERIDSVENYILLRDKSEIDLLTGLNNRGAGVEKLEEMMRQKVCGAFMMIDIDDFKDINDRYGHAAGDEALVAIARKIRSVAGPGDIVIRMGGDEFAIFAVGLQNAEQCADYIERLLTEVKDLRIASAGQYQPAISVGCAVCDENGPDFQELYRMGDDALYKAKHAGKNRCSISA